MNRMGAQAHEFRRPIVRLPEGKGGVPGVHRCSPRTITSIMTSIKIPRIIRQVVRECCAFYGGLHAAPDGFPERLS